ncbi:hypothetical protein HDR65_01545, partial [bacterium]|nr:hypothetical protein [bacterium]
MASHRIGQIFDVTTIGKGAVVNGIYVGAQMMDAVRAAPVRVKHRIGILACLCDVPTAPRQSTALAGVQGIVKMLFPMDIERIQAHIGDAVAAVHALIAVQLRKPEV